MCGLAHHFEAAGIATVLIGLVPQHVAAMRPPRALLVPFEFGRPFGAPDRPDLQDAVMEAALRLLDAPGPAPIVATFEGDAQAGDAAPWVCPVSFPAASPATQPGAALAAEVQALKPWFERAQAARGRSAAGASGLSIDQIVDWLPRFLSDPLPEAPPGGDGSLAGTFKLAAEDLKTFYLEAATAQPGTASSAELRDWLYGQTAVGALLLALREKLSQHEDSALRLYAAFTLVPEAFLATRH